MKPEEILILSIWGFGELSLLIIYLFSTFNKNILFLRQMRFWARGFAATLFKTVFFGGYIFVYEPRIDIGSKAIEQNTSTDKPWFCEIEGISS